MRAIAPPDPLISYISDSSDDNDECYKNFEGDSDERSINQWVLNDDENNVIGGLTKVQIKEEADVQA